jgi:biopolymer transport protein ExbB/TolQ
MRPELIANVALGISFLATVFIIILGIVECAHEMRFSKQIKEEKDLRKEIIERLDKLGEAKEISQTPNKPGSQEHQELLYYIDYKFKLNRETIDNRLDERLNRVYNELDSIKKRLEDIEKRLPPQEEGK